MTPAQLRSLRSQLGWSQRQLAEAIYIFGDNGAELISKLESGRKEMTGPQKFAFETIARDNGITVTEE